MTAIPRPNPTENVTEPPWNSLGKPTLGILSAPGPAIVIAGVTFGLLPAVVWPWRWAKLLDRERPYYRDLANWWVARVTPADALELERVLAPLRPRPVLVALPVVAAMTGLVAALMMLFYDRHDFHDLLPRLTDCAYRFHPGSHVFGSAINRHVHDVWMWGLIVAYACHLYAVRTHGRAVGDLVRWTNGIARSGDIGRVRNETRRIGLGPVWVIGAVVLCFLHAWWAIPMVIAGAAQRRYAEVGTLRLQQALAAQAGAAGMVGTATGGTVNQMVSESPREVRICPAPNCGHRLPGPAAFCPRCGSATMLTNHREA